MKKSLAALVCLALLTPLPGCYYLSGQYFADQRAAYTAAKNAHARTFVGRHQDALLKAFGAPSQTLEDNKGGRIWVYTEVSETVQPARSTTNYDPKTKSSTTTTYPSQTTRATTQAMYWINANGTIYDASWKQL